MTDIDGIVGTAVTGAVALGALGLVSNMMYGVQPAKKKKKKKSKGLVDWNHMGY
jgi:hypothetical protein